MEAVAPPAEVEAELAALDTETREIVGRLATKYLSQHGSGYAEIPGAVGRVWRAAINDAKHEPRSAPKGAADAPVGSAIVTRMADVESRSVEWLWPGRIPLGTLTLVEGDPGCGKSTVLLELTSRVTRGLAMPEGGGGSEPRSVVLLSAEDDPGAVIRPRLEAAGADLARVVILHMKTDAGAREPIISDADVAELERVALAERAALIIVDPVVAYLSDGTDTNSDHSVRRALMKLRRLAEYTGAAVVAVRHWRKGASDVAIYRGGGSIGFIGAARAALAVGYDPEDESRLTRILAVAKCNLAPIAPSLAFTLQQRPNENVAHVEWLGVSGHAAGSLTAAPPPQEDRAAMGEATDFLRVTLAPGPVPAEDVKSEARARDISVITLKRAKKSLCVEAYKEGFGREGRWMWKLPAARGDAYESEP